MRKLLVTGMLATGLLIGAVQANYAVANDTTKPTTQQVSKLDINKATVKQLTALKGIGEAKAKAIVEYRARINGFTHIDDLKEVKGIGDKLVLKLKEHISI